MIEPITIESVKALCECCHLENDLVIFDEIAKVPIPSVPRRMGCIMVALCLEGEAKYRVDTMQHNIKAGDVIIISTNQVTDECELSTDCSGMAILMSENFFREIISGVHEISSLFLFSRRHPVCHLEPEEADVTKNYFTALNIKANESTHRFRRETVISMMRTMIYDLSNVIYRIMQDTDLKSTRADKIFTDFLMLVENNYRTQRRVGWYALNMGITPKYLSEMIKQASRRTPNDWIDDYVTLELRVQLKNTSKNIKEITQELNFPNQSFLGKYFKEHVGMSPSEYRKKQ